MALTIKAFPRYSVSEWGEVFGPRGRLKACKDKRGYHRVWLYDSNGKRFEKYVHRLVAECFVDGDKGLTVNHIDGNKNNNHKSNLEWMSNADNLKHSFEAGLRDTKKTWATRRKTNNGFRLVPKEIQSQIINAYESEKISMRELGRRFSVDRGTIGRIISRRKVAC